MKEKWIFMYFEMEHCLFLDGYVILERDSTKSKKWDIVRQYQRLGRQRDHINNIIKEEDITIPESVIQQVKEEFISTLKVSKWNRS
jgi:hypothetical protein